MKRFFLLLLFAVSFQTLFAQRGNIDVSKSGLMTVDGDTVAWIEKDGCKALSPSCHYFVSNADGKILITFVEQTFKDRSMRSPEFPDGPTVVFFTVSFAGYDQVAEVERTHLNTKPKHIAQLVHRWQLLQDGQLNLAAVHQFLVANGTPFSDRISRQENTANQVLDIIRDAVNR